MTVTPELFRTRLADANVKKVVVIDDAFNQRALMSLIDSADVDTFWEKLHDIEGSFQSLEQHGIPCNEKQAFEEDGLFALWEARSFFDGPLKEEINILFLTPEEKWSQPTIVAQNLQRLGLDVVCHESFAIPQEGASNPLHDAQVVFLDYDLEGSDKIAVPGAKSLSHEIATYLGGRRGDSPFLVLFSSLNEVESHAETFRETALYLRGSFLFLRKSDAVTLQSLCDHLAPSCLWSRDIGHFRHFFLTLRKQLRDVSTEVEKKLLQLDVQDYAHFQRVALQEDGAPLGEYMLDLFGAVLSHEFRNGADVQEARAALDKLDLTSQHLPFHTQPTASMERIYRAVLTEPGISVGFAEPHPAAEQLLREINCVYHKMPPLLMLGDIFAKSEDDQVLIVMNSACDMQYSERGRDPKWNMSIMLLHGNLESLGEFNHAKHSERMRWLRYNDKNFRVLWDLLTVSSVKLCDFDEWQRENEYKRISRLSLPHSLALKQSWLSNLSRIGLPVSPPIHDIYDMEVFAVSSDGTYWERREMLRGAAIISTHPSETSDKIRFSITVGTRDILFRNLTSEYTVAVGTRKDAAKVALEDPSSWLKLMSEYFAFSTFKDFLAYKFPTGPKPVILFQKGDKPAPSVLGDNAYKTVSLVAVLSPAGSVPDPDPDPDPDPAPVTVPEPDPIPEPETTSEVRAVAFQEAAEEPLEKVD